MSEYYQSAYQKRLNRYGLDYQSRVQGQRERNFEDYLYKSIYRVDFLYQDEKHPASLEHYNQDQSKTISYLLTRRDLEIPNGTILDIESRNEKTNKWMVWWLEQVEASGYNRYVVLRLTHELSWTFENVTTTQWAYFSGPGNKTIQSTVQTSGANAVMMENNNLHLFVTPFNKTLVSGGYLEIIYEEITQGFTIKEFDIHSTPGIAYVTVDPVPLRNKETAESVIEGKKDETTFWLNGGM